ncbi:ribonuclease G [Companilactobacillus farciminis]|uniref:ribonuclease G n=1 Tax=Companilactobacillus farciminis TaxID=1612 RepID=UPI0034D56159
MNETGRAVPNEIKGWNWGAFMFNFIWGIGNKTYLPLLCLIPIFNIFWIFVVGFKGNTWAWQKGNYGDVETFKTVQATWNRAGIFQFALAVLVVLLYFFIFAAMIGSLLSDY